MTPDIFTTRSVRPRDQHEAWRERFLPVLEVSGKYAADDGFPAENEVWNLGGLVMSRVSAPPVRVVRRRVHLRRDPVDHWVLTYCRRGATIIRTDRTSLEAPAGVPFLWSLGEESQSERTHVDRIQLFMPRDVFRDIAPLLDAARGSVLDTQLGRLLGDYLLAVERRLPSLSSVELPQLTSAMRAVVAATVLPSADRLEAARSQIEFGQLERVRQAVRRNLRSPTLGPRTLCRLAGMSRSALYRLLEGDGGVARYIQRQRLLSAHAVLSDPTIVAPISAIVESFCFADASAFSRAFRREFGRSPSEARSDFSGGMAAFPVPNEPATSQAADFGDLLRGSPTG